MIPPTKPSHAGYRFPPEVISHAIWLYFGAGEACHEPMQRLRCVRDRALESHLPVSAILGDLHRDGVLVNVEADILRELSQ